MASRIHRSAAVPAEDCTPSRRLAPAHALPYDLSVPRRRDRMET